MLINVESSKSLEDIRKTLEEKAKEKGFGVMAVHEVNNILENKGFPIDYTLVIYEVCMPRAASEVLKKNPYISTALPCRISIIQDGNRYILSTIKPTYMIDLYKEPELKGVAEEVENLIKEIMEACS